MAAPRAGQHGFARDMGFEWTERGVDRAVLRLTDSAESRAQFPFPFVLELIYEAEGDTLSVTTRVTNPGDGILPCGVGAHPGFRWPLVDGVPKDRHVIVFESRERGPALTVEDGLLGAEKPLPFDGKFLAVTEALFTRDALVMPGIMSRGARYSAIGEDGGEARALSFSWEGFKDLGIWSKPGGAPFVCIEPWFSMASPVGWDGEFVDKPGILHLAPRETHDFVWTVTV